MGGSARVSIVAQERREVRERGGFYRGAGAPSVKVSIVAQERREGRKGWECEGAYRGTRRATDFAQDAAQDAA